MTTFLCIDIYIHIYIYIYIYIYIGAVILAVKRDIILQYGIVIIYIYIYIYIYSFGPLANVCLQLSIWWRALFSHLFINPHYILSSSDNWLSNSFGLLYVTMVNFFYIHLTILSPFIFTTSFHNFPFQYWIYAKFVFDSPYVIGQISFMSVYFMCETTFMIVISLFERTLCWIHVHFFIILFVTVTAYTLHTLLEIFPWGG